MKKKRTIKGVAIIMSLLTMLGLAGCTNNTQKRMETDNAKVIEFLNKKYNKEFKISEYMHTVYSASGNAERLRQGTAYCIDDTDNTFWVYIDNDNDEIYGDTYQDIPMEPYAQEYYEKIMKNNWSNCKTKVILNCKATKDQVYTKENIEDYLTNEVGNSYLTVFIQSSDNTEKQATDIYLFSKKLKEKGLNGTFNYAYMKDISKISDEEVKNRKKSIETYIKEGVVTGYCTVYIDERHELSIEEIKAELDKKY